MPFTLPNGLQDVTTSMNVGNFIPGFTLSATSALVSNDDPLGIWFDSTADQATNLKDATLTVAADHVNLGSFDLTAVAWPEYVTGDGLNGSFLFTVTGYKVDGSTVVTTFHNQKDALTLDQLPDFSAFTGITKFDVRIQAELYGGQWLYPVSNLTFDSFTIANAAPPNVSPAFVNPASLALTAAQNGSASFGSQLGVADADAGQTLTWSQGSTAPAHGTVSFSGATASSGSGTLTPGGTITYTPTAGYAGTDTFTVKVSDGYATATRTVTVNVTPATPSAPDLAPASDLGTSSSDNLTSASSLTFTGTGAAGDSSSTVTVFIDKDGSGTKNAGDVTGSATISNGIWTVSGLSTAGLADGSYNVYAVTSAGGVTGATSSALGIQIDKTAPTLAISSSKAALKAGETATITFTFSEDPGSTFSWSGTSGDVAVTGGTLSALSGTGTVRTAVFTPDAATNSGTASITVAGGAYTDAAGNNGGAGATPSITFDTLAPTVTITSDVPSLKIGETATITFTFSEDPGAGFAWDGTSGDVTVSGGTLSAISGTGLVRTAVFTPDANTNGGTASITVAFGTYTDAAGNASNAGATPSLTFDTLAPAAPSSPSLAVGSDTGTSSSDGLTRIVTPTLSGTAEAGATVKLYEGATQIGSGSADGSGNWAITTSALADGAHTITAVATDAAGNVSTASGPLRFTVDTTAPTLAITSDKAALVIGETATITFTFSEDPGTSFDAGDITVSGGTLGAISGTGLVRTAVFTPEANTNAGAASISVDPGTYTDAAGNTGGAGATPSITFDTQAPTVTISSDKGALKIGETATISFTFSEDPGATFDAGDVAVSGGTLSAISGTGAVRTAVFTPDANTNGGTASITIGAGSYADAAGNAGGAGARPGITFDTQAPAVAISSDKGALKIGETATITFTFSEDPGASFSWDGTSGDVVVGGGTLSAISGTGLVRTAVFTPDANTNGGGASITLGAGSYADAAGNAGGAGATPSITFDTQAPTVTISSDKGALKIGETAAISFSFSEDPGATFTSGDIAVSGGTLSAISGTGLVRTAVFTPDANTNGGVASITLGAGSYADAAGNAGGAGTTPGITFDTQAPTVAISSDKGALKIGETATITFTFSEDPGASFSWDGISGDVAVSGGTLSAISGTGLVRTAVFTPDANTNGGGASITIGAGSYADAAGNAGGAGTAPSLLFDTLAPAAPSTPALAAGSDTGTSSSDNLTKTTTPTITGTAEAGATIKVYDGATQIGTGTADGAGHWAITSSTLGESGHTITAIATDAAGNTGVVSPALAITVDTTAPTLAISSDKSTLGVGETATITFTFSEDPGSTFSWDGTSGDIVVHDGTLSAIAGAGNVRTAVFTPAADVDGGAASITVAAGTYADAAGNGGLDGVTPSLVLHTWVPPVVVQPGSIAVDGGVTAIPVGNYAITGSAGLDEIAFTGAHTQYTVTQSSISGPEGSDTLSGIERIRFGDGYAIALDVDGNAGEIYRLYLAAFGRAPDLPGLGYQINDLDQGNSLEWIASNFIASPEGQTLFGAVVDNAQFITLLYQHVLHRDPDAAGLQFHLDEFARGETWAQMLVHFSESPENQANVIGQIENGVLYVRHI